MRDLFKMNLQMFAAEDGGDGGAANPEGEQKPAGEETPPVEKKYSDEDVNKIIDGKFAKWKEEQKKEQKEAERKAKMSAEDKIKEEKSELEKKIEEYERKEKVRDNIKTASTVLSDAELPHDDDLLELLADEDEDTTKSSMEILISYISKVKKNSTAQKTPSEGNKFKASGDDHKKLADRAREKRIIK